MLNMRLNSFSFSGLNAGLLAVLIGYSSSIAIVLQAAQAAGVNQAQLHSWMWAIGIGVSLSTFIPSLLYKTPILTAWSTPGAAFLSTSLLQYGYTDAIGIFIFASTLMTIVGLTGLFHRISRWIPMHLASAMLAGILVQFGLNLFHAAEINWPLVLIMLSTYFIARFFIARLAIVLTLLSGVTYLFFHQTVPLDHLHWGLTWPVWQTPTWNLSALLSVGLPLFLVTLSSQNLPGVAMIQSYGYTPPMSPIMTGTGLIGIVLAPFGGYAFNLAAITAALCLSDEAHPDPTQRYKAALWAGFFYLLCGLFGATLIGFFIAMPKAFIGAIAGLALMGTLSQSLAGAFSKAEFRESALFTFLATASGMSLFNIGSAFWGLLIGCIVHQLTLRLAKGK